MVAIAGVASEVKRQRRIGRYRKAESAGVRKCERIVVYVTISIPALGIASNGALRVRGQESTGDRIFNATVHVIEVHGRQGGLKCISLARNAVHVGQFCGRWIAGPSARLTSIAERRKAFIDEACPGAVHDRRDTALMISQ
jgi:hypothetical protein